MHTQEHRTAENTMEKHVAAARARKTAQKHIAAHDERKLAAGLRSKWGEAHRASRELGMLVADLDRRVQLVFDNGNVSRSADVLTPKFREALALVDEARVALTSLVD